MGLREGGGRICVGSQRAKLMHILQCVRCESFTFRCTFVVSLFRYLLPKKKEESDFAAKN